jgi:hypothetical protein
LGDCCAADERADGVVVAEGGGERFEEDGGEAFAAGVATTFMLGIGGGCGKRRGLGECLLSPVIKRVRNPLRPDEIER